MKFFLPLSWLYGGIMDIRNWLYDHKKLPSFHFEVPLISVGNLTVGGTGKTPHIEYLVRWLQEKYTIATLSRGYGRKTRGFLLASPDTSSAEIGDEPMQFYEKFGNQVVVSVCEERALAVPHILYHHPQVNLILLDDAFQHRPVNPDIHIMLTDYKRLFYKDYPFPVGRLRERRRSAQRADIVLVSKCPASLSKEEHTQIEKNIKLYSPKSLVFFTGFDYGTPKNIFSVVSNCSQNVALVSAIAQPEHFEQAIKGLYNVQTHFTFPDHHFFSERDITVMVAFLEKNPHASLLCTEKDAVKLKKTEKLQPFAARVFSIGIEVRFLENNMEEAFQKLVLGKIEAKHTQEETLS